MKNSIKKIIKISLITLILFSSTNVVNAQLDDYTVLTPLPKTTTGCTVDAATGKQVCKTDFETYLPGMFNLMVAVAAGLAFVMITLGGITYATSDALTNKSQGKEWITNAIYGLLLVIGAYVILYTINPQILTFNIGVTVPTFTATSTVTAGIPMTAAAIAESDANRALLASGGVTTNAGPCTQGQTVGCTNLNGVDRDTINALITLKQTLCKCTVVITGGTEGGHATHGVNKPIFDIRPDVNLNKYILNNANTPIDGTNKEMRDGGYRYSFTYEVLGGNSNGTSSGAHWHVVVSPIK